MSTMETAGLVNALRMPIDAGWQAAVLAKQKQVMEEQGEQAVRLIEAARVLPPHSDGLGRILDIRV